jgi:DNA polymerase III epsilon subunit-like protein
MKYVAFDTETTGRPLEFVTPTKHNLHNYEDARLLSIAAVAFDDGEEVDAMYAVVRPDGFKVGATEIHGITEEEAYSSGRPFADVMSAFVSFVSRHGNGPMVAHNSAFDENIVSAEMLRRGYDDDLAWFRSRTFLCTFGLWKKRNFCRTGKLVNCYKECIGGEFDAHHALFDARACGELFWYMRSNPIELPVSNIDVPIVHINASDVATAVGCGIKDPQELVKELWKKHSPHTFTDMTRTEKVQEIARANKPVQTLLKKFTNHRAVSVDDLKDKIQEVMSVCTTEHLRPVRDHLTSELNKNFARQDGSRPNFYNKTICTIQGTRYQLVGVPGQVVDDTLIQKKKRTKKLFNRLVPYEEVQCRVYLELLKESVHTCCLVEQFNGRQSTQVIHRDSMKWFEILSDLKNFCRYFHSRLSLVKR